MLTIDRFHNIKTGRPLAGYFIRTGAGKIVAIGADRVFVKMSCPRYARDCDLVRKVADLAGGLWPVNALCIHDVDAMAEPLAS